MRRPAAERALAFKRRGRTDVPPGVTPVVDICDPRAREILIDCGRHGWPMPDIGYEPSDSTGAIVGLAELAWPSLKLALLTPEQSEFSGSLANQGWTILILPVSEEEMGAFFRKSDFKQTAEQAD